MQGIEWIIEAHGCDPDSLTDVAAVRELFSRLVSELGLHPVRESIWHQFPQTGGLTGLCLLSESHITCHTFPEYESLCLNVFCCRPRPDWDFAAHLKSRFKAAAVRVRRINRPYLALESAEA